MAFISLPKTNHFKITKILGCVLLQLHFYNVATFSNIQGKFDLQSFLDPKVVEEVMPLPVLFPKSEQQHRVAVIDPPNSENLAGSLRQISLAPTTAFIVRRSFNTSCAFTIPLFTFTTTQSAPFTDDSTVHIANQMVYFLFAVLYTTASFIVPVIFTGIRDPTITGRSQGEMNSEALLNRLLAPHPLVDFMGTKGLQRVGLDGRKCLLKTICDAHRSDNGYGILALPFQIFFPPPSNETSDSRSSSAQIAARHGAYQMEKDCGKLYPCLLDVLDVAAYFRDWWFLSN